jgi:hypothetical protein
MATASFYIETPTGIDIATAYVHDQLTLGLGPNHPTIHYVFFGNPQANIPGIQWGGYLTTPIINGSEIGGEIALVQLVKSTTEYNGITKSTGNDYYLDKSFPYASKTINTSLPNPDYIVASDTPGIPILSTLKISADNHFKVYLMYRPPGNTDNTIWVSCAMLAWDLQIEMIYASGSWSYTLAVYPSPGVKLTHGNLTTVLPTWNENIKNIPQI